MHCSQAGRFEGNLWDGYCNTGGTECYGQGEGARLHAAKPFHRHPFGHVAVIVSLTHMWHTCTALPQCHWCVDVFLCFVDCTWSISMAMLSNAGLLSSYKGYVGHLRETLGLPSWFLCQDRWPMVGCSRHQCCPHGAWPAQHCTTWGQPCAVGTF